MRIKHIDLPDALTQLPEERIEEALHLDSAEALSKAKSSEKALRARANNQKLKRWLPVPMCAALCLAVFLPLTLGWFGNNREDLSENKNKGENPMQIANPWIHVESVNEVCDALHIRLPELPCTKTVKSCEVLCPEKRNLSGAEMGDILFDDGSRLRLRIIGSDAPDASEMDRFGGVYGAALNATEQRGDVTLYHFKTSDSAFTAWISNRVYYWYESVTANDSEQMISLLLSDS